MLCLMRTSRQLKYYLGIMLKAYNEFESRVEHLKNRTLSKPERIKAMIDQKVGKITKKEIMDAHPDISKTTVERTLADLVKSEYIAKVGSGPATGYVKIQVINYLSTSFHIQMR